jgi:hypothetical protein
MIVAAGEQREGKPRWIQEKRREESHDCGCRREGGRKAMINTGEEKGGKS